ncbi:hypothetical protein [Streptomyces sp. KLOTTS4A1]|uniref:hypothetical protein n=1 Tax=Streptomyces sp. KLOTTS4A1 TaxID=3390996 RepID=UPI0039F5B3BB
MSTQHTEIGAGQAVPTRRTPMGRKVMRQLRYHGAPQLRIKRAQLEERGVEWITKHIVGVEDGLPRLADGRSFDVGTVVWATGYRQVFDWIDLPVPIENGWPVEYRGVVEEVPGLYFCGLAFQYAFASGEIHGVSRDSAYLARHIARRAAARPVPVAA